MYIGKDLLHQIHLYKYNLIFRVHRRDFCLLLSHSMECSPIFALQNQHTYKIQILYVLYFFLINQFI